MRVSVSVTIPLLFSFHVVIETFACFCPNKNACITSISLNNTRLRMYVYCYMLFNWPAWKIRTILDWGMASIKEMLFQWSIYALSQAGPTFVYSRWRFGRVSDSYFNDAHRFCLLSGLFQFTVPLSRRTSLQLLRSAEDLRLIDETLTWIKHERKYLNTFLPLYYYLFNLIKYEWTEACFYLTLINYSKFLFGDTDSDVRRKYLPKNVMLKNSHLNFNILE